MKVSVPAVSSEPWLLALGVVSTPGNVHRRWWIRNVTRLHSARIVQRFVVGSEHACSLAAEYGDMLFVEAPDDSPQSCVEKSFAWWALAIVAFPR